MSSAFGAETLRRTLHILVMDRCTAIEQQLKQLEEDALAVLTSGITTGSQSESQCQSPIPSYAMPFHTGSISCTANGASQVLPQQHRPDLRLTVGLDNYTILRNEAVGYEKDVHRIISQFGTGPSLSERDLSAAAGVPLTPPPAAVRSRVLVQGPATSNSGSQLQNQLDESIECRPLPSKLSPDSSSDDCLQQKHQKVSTANAAPAFPSQSIKSANLRGKTCMSKTKLQQKSSYTKLEISPTDGSRPAADKPSGSEGTSNNPFATPTNAFRECVIPTGQMDRKPNGLKQSICPFESQIPMPNELCITKTTRPIRNATLSHEQTVQADEIQRVLRSRVMAAFDRVHSSEECCTQQQPLPLVTAACVQEADGTDEEEEDVLLVGTQCGKLLQVFERRFVLTLKTQLQPVVGLVALPKDLLLVLEATGRLTFYILDSVCAKVEHSSAKVDEFISAVRIVSEKSVGTADRWLPRDLQLVASLTNVLVFTNQHTLLLPLKTLPLPQPLSPLKVSSKLSHVDCSKSPSNAAPNTSVHEVNGFFVICEFVRSGLFAVREGRRCPMENNESIVGIAGHARSPLVAIALINEVLLLNAATFEKVFRIFGNSIILEQWLPNSVAMHHNVLFVASNVEDGQIKNMSYARLYCFPLGGPAQYALRWSGSLSNAPNVLAIVKQSFPSPKQEQTQVPPTGAPSNGPIDSLRVLSFCNRNQSNPAAENKSSDPSSTSAASASASVSEEVAGAGARGPESLVAVWDVELYDWLADSELKLMSGCWETSENSSESPVQSQRKLLTYAELESLLQQDSSSSTSMKPLVPLLPQPNLPVLTRLGHLTEQLLRDILKGHKPVQYKPIQFPDDEEEDEESGWDQQTESYQAASNSNTARRSSGPNTVCRGSGQNTVRRGSGQNAVRRTSGQNNIQKSNSRTASQERSPNRGIQISHLSRTRKPKEAANSMSEAELSSPTLSSSPHRSRTNQQYTYNTLEPQASGTIRPIANWNRSPNTSRVARGVSTTTRRESQENTSSRIGATASHKMFSTRNGPEAKKYLNKEGIKSVRSRFVSDSEAGKIRSKK